MMDSQRAEALQGYLQNFWRMYLGRMNLRQQILSLYFQRNRKYKKILNSSMSWLRYQTNI